MSEPVLLLVTCQMLTWNRERKINHYERAALVKEARTAAYYVARDWLGRGGHRFDVPVTVTFAPIQGKGVLADTAGHGPTCKAALDGLVDARLIPADTPAWVTAQTYLPPTRGRTTGVWVTVAPAPTLDANHPAGY